MIEGGVIVWALGHCEITPTPAAKLDERGRRAASVILEGLLAQGLCARPSGVSCSSREQHEAGKECQSHQAFYAASQRSSAGSSSLKTMSANPLRKRGTQGTKAFSTKCCSTTWSCQCFCFLGGRAAKRHCSMRYRRSKSVSLTIPAYRELWHDTMRQTCKGGRMPFSQFQIGTHYRLRNDILAIPTSGAIYSDQHVGSLLQGGHDKTAWMFVLCSTPTCPCAPPLAATRPLPLRCSNTLQNGTPSRLPQKTMRFPSSASAWRRWVGAVPSVTNRVRSGWVGMGRPHDGAQIPNFEKVVRRYGAISSL